MNSQVPTVNNFSRLTTVLMRPEPTTTSGHLSTNVLVATAVSSTTGRCALQAARTTDLEMMTVADKYDRGLIEVARSACDL